MIVGENTCDGKKKAYETLDALVDNLYVMDLPQVKSENGKARLRAEYGRFKAAGMINRVSSVGDIVFTGGVAQNPGMRALLADKLGRRILSPQDPQLVGALGAALLVGE